MMIILHTEPVPIEVVVTFRTKTTVSLIQIYILATIMTTELSTEGSVVMIASSVMTDCRQCKATKANITATVQLYWIYIQHKVDMCALLEFLRKYFKCKGNILEYLCFIGNFDKIEEFHSQITLSPIKAPQLKVVYWTYIPSIFQVNYNKRKQFGESWEMHMAIIIHYL